MPAVELDPSLTMWYEDDYFGSPWREPETVLLIHGVAESSLAWYAWVPSLAESFRVIRPDLRGFGQSSVPGKEYDWSVQGLATDLVRLLDALGLDAVHVVGAKLGGTIAMQFAADFPDRTRSLTVVSSPVKARDTGGTADLTAFPAMVREAGVRGWAAATQRDRLGSGVSIDQLDWWTEFMGRTDPDVCIAVTAMAGRMDISEALPRIQAPSLVVTTQYSALAAPEVVQDWQQMIPNSRLLILPGDSYHVAAAMPELCVIHVLDFLQHVAGK